MLNKIPISVRLMLLIFVISAVSISAYSMFSQSNANLTENSNEVGRELFKKNCSGCHPNGKNLIEPDKPVIGSGKLKDKELFKAFIENPPKPMPKYTNIASESEQLEAIYKYVLSLKEK